MSNVFFQGGAKNYIEGISLPWLRAWLQLWGTTCMNNQTQLCMKLSM